MVETFDQANHNSLQEYNVALITLLTYPVSACTAERGFSGMKRLQTPLRRIMKDERLSSLAILHIHKHKDVIDIDGIMTDQFALSGGYTYRPFLVTSLMASLFYPFFAVNSLYLTDNTRDGQNLQLITAFPFVFIY